MGWSVYRLLWWLAAATATVRGCLSAVEHLPGPEALLIGAGMAANGVLCGWVVWGPDDAHLRSRVLVSGAVSGGTTLAVTGLVAAPGSGGLLVLAGLGCTALPLLHRCGRRSNEGTLQIATTARPQAVPVTIRLGVPRRREHRPGDVAVPPPAGSLSTAELCDAWRHSHHVLESARDVAGRHAAVVERASCLDELEQRDPSAFARWLEDPWSRRDPGPLFIPEEP